MSMVETVIDGEVFKTVDGARCHIYSFGDIRRSKELPFVVMPLSGDSPDLILGQHERLDPLINAGEIPAFILAVFETADWFADLSPWSAPPPGRAYPAFTGGSGRTLDWVLGSFIPEVRAEFPVGADRKPGIAGYSMAGLFALWSLTRTDAFAACASCSGSLWFEGFTEYLEKNPPRSSCAVYLSLGDREEFTKNPTFSKVGDATRRTAELLRSSGMVTECEYIKNPGRHTGAVGERMAAALNFIVKKLQN